MALLRSLIYLLACLWAADADQTCSTKDFGVAYYGNTIFTISSSNNTCACLGYYSSGRGAFGSVTAGSLVVTDAGNSTTFAGGAVFAGGASFGGQATFGASTGSCRTSLSDGLVFRLDGRTGQDAGPYMIGLMGSVLCNQTIGGVSGVCLMSGSSGVGLNLTKVVSHFPTGRASRSMCAWGYLSALVGKQWMFAYGTNTSGNSMFIGGFGPSGDFGSAGDDMPAGTWATGQWNHICGVYDGVTARLFWNGQQILAAPKTWSIPANPVGAFVGSQVDGGGDYWHGFLYDVRVYARGLGSSEVLTLYQATQQNARSACDYSPSGATVFNGAVSAVGGLTTGSESTTTLAGRLVASAASEFHGSVMVSAPMTLTASLRVDASSTATFNGNIFTNGQVTATNGLAVTSGTTTTQNLIATTVQSLGAISVLGNGTFGGTGTFGDAGMFAGNGTFGGSVVASSFVGDGRQLRNLSLVPEIASLISLVNAQAGTIATMQSQIAALQGQIPSLATSCRALNNANPAGVMSSGTYLISTPGGATNVYCDMKTAGGGWTMVWKAATDNYNTVSFSYFPNLSGPGSVLASATEIIFAFTDVNNAMTQAYRFNMPAGLATNHPMAIGHCSFYQITAIRVTDGVTTNQWLRVGYSNFGALCDQGCYDGRLSYGASTYGQICLTTKSASQLGYRSPDAGIASDPAGYSDFPHYAGFSYSGVDYCASSNVAYSTTNCNPNRLFTIFAR